MIAKGSALWIFMPVAMTVLFLFTIFYLGPYLMLQALLMFWLMVTIFFLVFFRDPERSGPREGLLSPADGRVMEDRGDDTVRIFMNVHNVHVNRAPLKGRVVKLEHRPGGLRPAFSKDSDLNERTEIVFETKYGEMVVTQIAGTLARRIVTYVKEGERVERGQRIGMIRLGSRVDVTIPQGFGITARKGQSVHAGLTVLAKTGDGKPHGQHSPGTSVQADTNKAGHRGMGGARERDKEDDMEEDREMEMGKDAPGGRKRKEDEGPEKKGARLIRKAR